MVNGTEFEIKSLPETRFRVGKVSPVDCLALVSQMSMVDFKQTQTMYKYIWENIEVEIGGKWFPVKVKDREVYMPEGIESNFTALQELARWFSENVIYANFQKSEE